MPRTIRVAAARAHALSPRDDRLTLWTIAAAASALVLLAATHARPAVAGRATARAVAAPIVASDTTTPSPTPDLPPDEYTGRDPVTGIPRYVTRAFSAEERRLLRTHFGIDEPSRLYRNEEGFVVYDSRRDTGPRDLVVTHRVGGRSARRAGESYAAFEARIRGKPAAYFGPDVRAAERRLDALVPEVRGAFRALLDEARRDGIPVTVVETYRSPERQAYLLARGGGLTYTATSNHSDGRAVDFRVGSGTLRDSRTLVRYEAFRALAAARGFVLEDLWDPGHVVLPDPAAQPGFPTIEALLAAARRLETTVASR
jgi:hypothetical protein